MLQKCQKQAEAKKGWYYEPRQCYESTEVDRLCKDTIKTPTKYRAWEPDGSQPPSVLPHSFLQKWLVGFWMKESLWLWLDFEWKRVGDYGLVYEYFILIEC